MADISSHGAHLRPIPAQSANPSPTSAATTSKLGERELIIKVRQDDWVQYEGAAFQLVAEGLIPENFEWPRAAVNKRWNANGFDYWLRRTRPEGHKGPMRSWLELDNWFLRVEVSGRDYHWHAAQHLKRKAEELRADFYRQTEAGSREWNANWRRFIQSVNDKPFQDFKALIPGLVPPRRGRKTKATSMTQGAQA